MNSLLRRFRGILLSAALWGLVWTLVGGVGGLIRYFLLGPVLDVGPPPPFLWLAYSIRVGMGWGTIGAISGVMYAGILIVAEGSRSVQDLSLGRVALWGALGALVVPLALFLSVLLFEPADLSFELLPLIAMSALGVGSAVGTLLLARRASKLGNGNVAA